MSQTLDERIAELEAEVATLKAERENLFAECDVKDEEIENLQQEMDGLEAINEAVMDRLNEYEASGDPVAMSYAAQLKRIMTESGEGE